MSTDFHINTATGLLEPGRYRPSPHADDRPQNMDIDLIVVHGISLPPGEFGSEAIESFFCGELNTSLHPSFQTIADVRVSSHLLIKRNGEVVQFVPFFKRAWHAGPSSFGNRTSCNDFSIGIELEGTDDIPYEKIQYTQLIAIIRLLMKHYPNIHSDHVVGHVHIAPTRKTDPGPLFDWAFLRENIEERS